MNVSTDDRATRLVIAKRISINQNPPLLRYTKTTYLLHVNVIDLYHYTYVFWCKSDWLHG